MLFVVIRSFGGNENHSSFAPKLCGRWWAPKGNILVPMAEGRFSMLTIVDGWENLGPMCWCMQLGGHVASRWLIVG